jgi:chorismate mutase
LHKQQSTPKSILVLIIETNYIAARKVISVFHSVGKDYFPAAILAEEGNFGREHG